MLTFALGISAGVLLGMLAIPVAGFEIGLGNAGGLLAAGLAIGYLRSVRPVFGRLPEATSWWLMEFGLLLFMAGVGLQAGGSFVETLTRSGPMLVVAGIIITVVPILVAYFVGSLLLRDPCGTRGCCRCWKVCAARSVLGNIQRMHNTAVTRQR